jgi:oxygen-independent coproporphyrinogen-3 oxidase
MLNFKQREPIGSSTFPMPDLPFDEATFRIAMGRREEGARTATVYIHIPFCDQICSFCGFNKMVSPEDLKADYVEALIQEIERAGQLPYFQSLDIGAVYLGGGTPNALSGAQLFRILQALRRNLPLSADCEISCEGTPQNFTPERIDALHAGGVNRISTGIQTFNADIRRDHLHMRNGKEELLASIATVAAAFDNFNLDMIYNLPGQTDEIWSDDLETAIGAGSTHLTCYPLVLLEKTVFYREFVRRKAYEAPAEDREIRYFRETVDRLRDSPFTDQYSVRDWARPGRACRYIQLNAEANHVVAFGAGAHGFVGGITYRSIAAPRQYVEAIDSGWLPMAAMRVATEAELMQRYMVMGLRLRSFDPAPFERRFGRSVFDVYAPQIEALVEGGYIEVGDGRIVYTATGDVWANNVRTFFEGSKNRAVGYTDTLAAGETGKDHYSAISRVKASADIEAA